MDAPFHQALQVETAMLQKAHPILAEQLARAHALICDGKVWPEEDGKSFLVQSSSHPATWYSVNGHCACKASAFRPEPCKHRTARRLYERVVERLCEEEERYDLMTPAPVVEVPAIMSTTLTIEGRCVEVKLCDTSDARLLARLTALLQQYPVSATPTLEPAEGWCATHGVQMRWNPGKDGKPGWFSHKAHDGWCKGQQGGRRG